jgi:uncharacterized protein
MAFLIDKPLIKVFRTANSWYAYDVGTNDFYLLDEHTYQVLHDDATRVSQLGSAPTAFDEIRDAQRKGIFAVSRLHAIEYPLTEEQVVASLSSELGALILEVTQFCNLRCNYCSFSGNYPLNRIHSELHMEWPIAKAAIDLYLKACRKPTIGFFGGEPLLQLQFIVKCIDYANQAVQSSVEYNLTTNGTLLTRSALVELAERNVNLSISIDGPKCLHDRHRRTRSGSPTWDNVFAGIRLASKMDPAWFRTHVRFMMLALPPYDLRPYEDFIKSNSDVFQDSRMLVLTFVNPTDSDQLNPSPQDAAMKLSELERLRTNYRDAHISGAKSSLTVEPSLFDKSMFRLHYRHLPDHVDEPIPPNGSCIPALRRLFVDSQGTMHICERINPSLAIGDVSKGINNKLLLDRLRDYVTVTKEECLACWASRFCAICPAHVAGNGAYDKNKKLSMCSSVKENLVREFILYNEILEHNPQAFDYMGEFYML